MQRILGIDPGLTATGYAVIDGSDAAPRLVTSGVIATRGGALPQRLGAIFKRLDHVIRQHHPVVASVENVFMHKDASAALKLGQARGVAVCASVVNNMPVYEYATRLVKKTVVGKGNASKDQVQFMVAHLLKITVRCKDDETDAMALALCHALTSSANARLARAAS